ncbi:DEAD/DEAH box helicase family protein [Pinibacter soli]|uniref:Type I restriction-modification enzyme R subunit C-terminal domain-containing protein n=1 Tax=Pinibacter soli TaxID=3044211 RepID=A0ABT6RHF8_9BACT|nr:DEAD/DEAH box helicase family protein [Pinibacter soli]MDI3322008.1 type I restriction-modification enzyme R subunit C-terminal domain-containing protein [Pinibacter soli]
MNQNPEQLARDRIDAELLRSGWIIQNKTSINLGAGVGIAIREYQTDIGPADYVLFVNKKPVGIIEAKRAEEGEHLTIHEEQSEGYATAKLKYLQNDPLPFVYESTGELTRFTDYRDPKPRSRPVFSFHRPETFAGYAKEEKSLRTRLHDLPALVERDLRDCQITAINTLEDSFKKAHPKALVQMATGSGKTFTAITFVYRLLKYAKAKRILFLVDTKNLGEQAEQEFMAFVPNDDNRKFTELYGVTRLKSSFIPADNQVYISTIQRMYSILKGTEMDESAEEENPNEGFQPREPLPVVYNEKIPPEFFDFIVIDECHRSIYNLWKQVLDYFDVFQVGLTATPDNRTFGYFNQNLVSDYGYEKAVIDGVLVPYNVFTVETKITKDGSTIALGEKVDKRERLTRRKFWESVDEDIEYSGKQLDKDIVNPSTIRMIVRAIRDNLPFMFPDRLDKDGKFEVPKTLIFAKTDSHAEDIIEIVREEFAEENKFCKKITYRSDEDPKTVLSQFRNDYYPRIAVTVDMIATGTDIRPLEVLVFMRDVKSRSYYEQMKGRGTRTCSLEDLRTKGTPSAKFSKDHFVIIDAIGVEQSQKTDSRPLEKKPGMSLKDVLQNVAMGNTSEEILSTLANRLVRLDRQINEKEKASFADQAGGASIGHVVKQLLNAYDPDTINNIQTAVIRENIGTSPDHINTTAKAQHDKLIEQAVAVFNNPELRNFIVDVRKKYDQVIDHINIDAVTKMGWVKDQDAAAELTISNFKAWMEGHKDEITALQIFYSQPYRRRELTYRMIKDLCDKLTSEQPLLAPSHVWRAYEQLKQAGGAAKNELTALVSLIRNICGIDDTLTSYDKMVDKNFQTWVFKKQAGTTTKFTEEQMQWLRMIKDYVAGSFHVEKEDFELDPFNKNGGLGKFYQLFKNDYELILQELNEALSA